MLVLSCWFLGNTSVHFSCFLMLIFKLIIQGTQHIPWFTMVLPKGAGLHTEDLHLHLDKQRFVTTTSSHAPPLRAKVQG